MGDGFKNSNGAILDQNPLGTKNPGKLDPGPMGPIFPIGPRGPIWALAAITLWGPVCKAGGGRQGKSTETRREVR